MPWPWQHRRFYLWILVNGLVLRPLLLRVNRAAQHHVACPGIEDGPHNTTGLEVIVAGVGRTGTHSVNHALEMLGMRTYGTYEAVFYMPEVYRQTHSPEHLVFLMRSCRVKAFVIEPHYDLLWKLLPVSPNARVILSTRDYESWAASSLSGTAKSYGYYTGTLIVPLNMALASLLCDWWPHALALPYAERGASFMNNGLATLLLENCVGARGGWTLMSSSYYPDWNVIFIWVREVFDEYHANVRFFVPKERLLEFDVRRHSWAELAAFLGRKAPAEGKLRRVGSGSAHEAAIRFQADPARWLCFWGLMLVGVWGNWLVFCTVWSLLAAVLGLRARSKVE